MEVLSKDQELTLSRWAIFVGRRPAQSVKAFLGAEKGLSADQIDNWWNHARARAEQGGNFGRDVRAAWLAHPATEESRGSGDNVFSSLNTSSLDPALKDTAMDTSFSFSQPESPWHHMDSPGVDSSSPLAPPNAFLPQGHHSSRSDSRSNYSLSLSSATADTNSLLSVEPRDSGYITQSVRSSRFSHAASSQSGHLSSSSLFDWNGEAWESTNLLTNSDQVINEALWDDSDDPFKDILPNNATFCSTIEPLSINKNKSDFPIPILEQSRLREQPKKLHRRQQSNVSRTTKAPGKFACTACHEPFTTKYEWARHEGSQCEPQKHWICMLGNDPTIATGTGAWECAFCNATTPDRDEMIGHLNHEHDINKCIRKPVAERTKTREDKFKDHLRKVHRLADHSTHWQRWQRAANAPEKHAWGCGFCGICLYSWDDRLKHVAEQHYENQQLDVSQWSSSRVIRGLLAQNQQDFQIADAWKRLVGANGDQKLEWPRENAELLKHKLECHEGTVAELVLEARRLAVPRKTASLARSNTTSVSKSGEKPLPAPPTSTAELDAVPPSSRFIPKTDVEMEDMSYL